MLAFFRQHVIGVLMAIIGGVIAVGGAIRDVWEATTLGLPNEFWLVVGLAIFFAATLSLIYKLWQRVEQPKSDGLSERAELRLLFRKENDTPEIILHVNIWRWYWLRNIFAVVDHKTGEKREHVIPNLFVVFDKPVQPGTLKLSSPDFILPRHEVKEVRERFAVIVFHEALPAGVLELRLD